ncbi:VOC family protein [Ralstonia pseudosolanacearum]|uniref:VOC family protein n=1 Tax=Ralstonia pseudosolanacearum TaxID=1310165 RepID=UPI0018D1C3CB|nr:VOC family protein [Ralstonia pseudosolanacearum]
MANALTDLSSFSFVLAVRDLEASASYFRDALGHDGMGWKLATRGSVRIMIGHCPDAMLPSATSDHSYFGYLTVANADALHAELVGRGAIILQPPANQPHGMREFLVGAPDGHRMMIGQDLS